MPRISFILNNRHFRDLNPIDIGWEDCVPGHCFGPAIRRYTLLHYVEQGHGTLYKNDTAYPVGEGEIFIILPGEVTRYVADQNDPWVYRWIAFDGELSAQFSGLPPVVKLPNVLFPRVPNMKEFQGIVEYALAGQLYVMMSELFASGKNRNHYVRQVKDYIQSSYMREISVEQIAESLSLDRRYLSRLFKEKTGQTVQSYLISVRMEEARRFLAEGRGVAETATLCGYADAFNFSKMFKRTYGISPAKWKNS